IVHVESSTCNVATQVVQVENRYPPVKSGDPGRNPIPPIKNKKPEKTSTVSSGLYRRGRFSAPLVLSIQVCIFWDFVDTRFIWKQLRGVDALVIGQKQCGIFWIHCA